MKTSIGLEGNQFNHCVMACIVAYSIFTVPSGLGLMKTTPGFWIPTIVSCLGVVLTTMGIIHGFSGFFGVASSWGFFEAGMLPGVCFVISTWYGRNELQLRLTLILAVALSLNSLSNLVSYVTSMMKGTGGLEGWRWIFIIKGCLSVVSGGFGYMLIFNYPGNSDLLNEKTENTYSIGYLLRKVGGQVS